jgi:hypothetical protein
MFRSGWKRKPTSVGAISVIPGNVTPIVPDRDVADRRQDFRMLNPTVRRSA